MKTAISIPDDVFRQAEQAAKRGMSRSELFTTAVREFLGVQRDATVTASYDEAFADTESTDVEFRRQAARKTLSSVEWEE
jgi:metal-responsive CopG/Arc/MetJ family transcriptional regulator